MGRSEERNKSQKMAAELIRQGYPHGRRRTHPSSNSGGLAMANRAGSAKYQRLVDSKAKGAS